MTNEHSYTAFRIAEASIALLAKVMNLQLGETDVDIPALSEEIKVGDVIEVSCTIQLTDRNQAEPAKFTEHVILPLECIGHADGQKPAFRVTQIIHFFKLCNKDISVCWGDPTGDGYVVWYSSFTEWVSDEWTTCSDYEDSELTQELVTLSNNFTLVHPEVAKKNTCA